MRARPARFKPDQRAVPPDEERAPKKRGGGPPIRCSFCGKTRREVRHLATSDTGAAICNQCVETVVALMHEHVHGKPGGA